MLCCIIFFIIIVSLDRRIFGTKDYLVSRRNQVPFSMALGNGELAHECFHKHFRKGTTRMKLDKETEEEGKKRGVNIWKDSRHGKKSSRPNYSHIYYHYLIK